MKRMNKKIVTGTSLIAGILLAGSAMAQVTPIGEYDESLKRPLSCQAKYDLLQSQYAVLDANFAITTEQLNECSATSAQLRVRLGICTEGLTEAQAEIASLSTLLATAISDQASCTNAKSACESAAATCQSSAQTLQAQLDAAKADLDKAKAALAAEQSKVASLSAQTAPSTLVVKSKFEKVITRLRFLALKQTGNLTNKVKATAKQGVAIGKQYEAKLAEKGVTVSVQK